MNSPDPNQSAKDFRIRFLTIKYALSLIIITMAAFAASVYHQNQVIAVWTAVGAGAMLLCRFALCRKFKRVTVGRITQWHRSRTMFAVINGDLMVAPIGDPRSHAEWLADRGWIHNQYDPLFEAIVRGYRDETGIHAYRGSDYNDRDVEYVIGTMAFRFKLSFFGCSFDEPIHVGAVLGEPGVPWKPLKSTTLQRLIEQYSCSPIHQL